ncbi:hypothetical protein DL768_011641 [Monosporascus sp. mg162]|nr:hypothetical protein DL768_011641 [Monosporascus sp. mg162]
MIDHLLLSSGPPCYCHPFLHDLTDVEEESDSAEEFGPVCDSGHIQVTACPDTGSDETIISLELTNRLSLEIKPSEGKSFSLANGTIVAAVGQTQLQYCFASDSKRDTEDYWCTAYVFSSLVVPVIMGASLLKETKTLTKYRDRMVEEFVPVMQALRVNSVGKPKQSVVCRLDSFVGCANPDTGSDLDLVRPEFCEERAFVIEPTEEVLVVQFADGSTANTLGAVQVPFSVGNLDPVKGFMSRGQTLDTVFHVLENLSSDILIGQDTIEELDLFNRHADSLLEGAPPVGISDCNIIRVIGTLERLAKKKIESAKAHFRKEKPGEQEGDNTDDALAHEKMLSIQRENANQELGVRPGRVVSPPPQSPYYYSQYLQGYSRAETPGSTICEAGSPPETTNDDYPMSHQVDSIKYQITCRDKDKDDPALRGVLS